MAVGPQIEVARYIKPRSMIESIPMAPGVEGALLRKDEDTKLRYNTSVHVEIFDLRDAEVRARYEKLLNLIANRKAELKFLSRQWSEDGTGVIVYVEWVDYLIDKE